MLHIHDRDGTIFVSRHPTYTHWKLDRRMATGDHQRSKALLMSHPTDRIDRALSTRRTLQTSYDMALDCIRRGIPGDFVECGVFAGAQCAAMAQAIVDSTPNDRWQDRRVHLFDSFLGIPAAGEYDNDYRNGGHPPGQSACSFQDVKAHMREWNIPGELLEYHVGWFHESIPKALGCLYGRGIAILRLDADLYESTKVCLALLYPLLCHGGWLIIDDFGLDGCRKAVLDYLAPITFPLQSEPLYYQKS